MKWAIVASQHRSLRQAAETLNVRQSTLSRRLREMEARLGTQLFERTNGGTYPTMPGREFLASARRILAETDDALRKLGVQSRGESGSLAIGVYASLSGGNMFAVLVEHHRHYPEVEVHTVDGSHNQLLSALTNNVVDIAIMTKSRSGWNDRVLSLWSERVIIALPAGHPLSEREVVGWSEIVGTPILISELAPQIRTVA